MYIRPPPGVSEAWTGIVSPARGMAEDVWFPILKTSTLARSRAITYARLWSCETINWVGTKLPWPKLNDVAVPLLAVGEHPAGARDTRNRSMPGESTAR